MKGNLKKIICLIMSSILLTGCNVTGTNIEEVLNIDNGYEKKLITKAERVELEEPVSRVKTLVDLYGYSTSDSKKVYFIGTDKDKKFNVIDANTNHISYQGMIEDNGEVCIGDFSDFNLPGEYYIESDNIGQSYRFIIDDERWDTLMWQGLEKMESVMLTGTTEDTIQTALCIHTLLFALQCYPTVFEQDNTMITWVLKILDSLITQQSEDGSFYSDYTATAICAGVMQMCSEQFGKYDYEISKQFEKTSIEAYKWMLSNEDKKNDEAEFYYMCQSFHTNKNVATYKEDIETYLENNIENINENVYAFMGATLYISSEKYTDRDICTRIMQTLVAKTEEISSLVKTYPFFVNPNLEEALENVYLICFIDYITPSREYMDIIKNTLHYLSGANMQNLIYLQNDENWNNFWSSIIMFCYADINS